MVRRGKALQTRLGRIKLANQMLDWLKEQPSLSNGGEGVEGCHTCERVIIPFSKTEGVDTIKAWQAWDILLEAGRRKKRPGKAFEVVSFKYVGANDAGEIQP